MEQDNLDVNVEANNDEQAEIKKRKLEESNGSESEQPDSSKSVKNGDYSSATQDSDFNSTLTMKPTALEQDSEIEGGISGDEVADTALLVGEKVNQSNFLPKRKHPPPVLTRCVCWSIPVLAVVAIFILCIIAGITIVLNPSCPLFSDLTWWKTTVVYQIYPQSFQDSSGNGTGDLNGIAQRLDYLEYLGVKAIWLNPIYLSPMADSGYDVADYKTINPLYGTMDDFKQLLSRAHKKGIKLLMDFVPNHTSDQHAWFKESRSSTDNPKRNWYMWAKPVNYTSNGTPVPPNNWVSVFGGSMWEYDSTTREFYLHQFAKQQPDLNFRNPDVLDALDDILRFWLDLGVDGFRVDAIAHLFEDPLLRDEELLPNQTQITYNSFVHNYTKDYPEIHGVARRWRKLMDSYGERLMIGEIYSDTKTVMSFFGSAKEPEFSFPFNFFLLENSQWTGTAVAKIVSDWINNQPSFGWPNWVLGNHDNPRIATKAGPERVRLLNVLLLLLPGTPTTYYGEELGLESVPVPKNLSRDTNTDQPRDGERTPMLWNNSAHAGFTTLGATPWLPLHDNSTIAKFNVETQKANPKSSLNLYRELVTLRGSAEFQHGTYKQIGEATEESLVFLRYYKEGLRMTKSRYVVAINFSGNETVVSANGEDFVESGTLILSSFMDHSNAPITTRSISLRPYEAIVIKGESDRWI
jgi:glycosidase